MAKRIWVFLNLLLISGFTQAAVPGEMLFGKWKVVAMLDPLPILSEDENEEKHAIGKYLIINQKEVRFQNEVGLSPVFTESHRIL